MNKPFKLMFVILMCISAIAVNLFYRDNARIKGSYESLGTPKSNYRENYIHIENSSEAQPKERTRIDKKRINILLLGIEGKARADTIIFISYDIAGSKMSSISIPRDTYFHKPGNNKGDQRKINAAYGRDKEKGCVDAVSKLLCNTPIDYYVSIDYEGVENIIDAIEGVELEVPIDMEAGGIKITKGKQVLQGREALQYLRFRKKYKDGDLGRIKAQQKLIKAVLSKLKYIDIPRLVGKSFASIRTNIPIKNMIEYARQFKKGDVKEASMYMLPGVPMYKSIGGYNWSYFFHNHHKVEEVIKKIYEKESWEQKKRKRYEFY